MIQGCVEPPAQTAAHTPRVRIRPATEPLLHFTLDLRRCAGAAAAARGTASLNDTKTQKKAQEEEPS
jgi:hypothetical protein